MLARARSGRAGEPRERRRLRRHRRPAGAPVGVQGQACPCADVGGARATSARSSAFATSLSIRSAHRALPRPGVQVDLGGIAKGFAVEVAAGITCAAVGSAAWSTRVAISSWWVCRQESGSGRSASATQTSPRHSSALIDLAGGALSTSSDASNFLADDGKLRASARSAHASPVHGVTERHDRVAGRHAVGRVVEGRVRAGTACGARFLASFPGTSGIVAYREPDGRVGSRLSARLDVSPRAMRTGRARHHSTRRAALELRDVLRRRLDAQTEAERREKCRRLSVRPRALSESM